MTTEGSALSMKPIISLLPFAFALLALAMPAMPAMPAQPANAPPTATRTPWPTALTTPVDPVLRPIYQYWLPWVSAGADDSPVIVIGLPPLPVCEIDGQTDCATPTLAVPPTESPPTAYP